MATSENKLNALQEAQLATTIGEILTHNPLPDDMPYATTNCDKDWWDALIHEGLQSAQNGSLVSGEAAYKRLQAKREARKI